MFGKIGRITPASSGTNPLRGDYLGGLITSNAGDYKDLMLSGRLYFAVCTAVAATVFSTTTTATGIIIWNPPTSGVNLVPYKWACQVYTSSASMTGLMLAIGTQLTIPTTTTAATLTGKALLTGSTGLTPGTCSAYSIGTVLAPVALWPLFHNTAGINTVGAEKIEGDLQGAFAFAPGTTCVIGTLGGTSSAINLSLTWEEVPVGL